MDDFKSFLSNKRKPSTKTNLVETEDLKLDIDILKEDSVEQTIVSPKAEVNKPKKKVKDTISEAQRFLSEDASVPTFQGMTTTGFIGAFNYVPEPTMFTEGAEYRNKNNGTVYKKVGNLWEEYVRDGRNGAQGMSVGGGCGVQEVTKIAKEQVELLGRAPFKMNKTNGVLESITITVSAGQYVTQALPVGPSYLFQYTGSGPFAIKTGDNLVVATQNDLPALTGLREILYITDTHISVFGVGPGQVTIVGGVGV